MILPFFQKNYKYIFVISFTMILFLFLYQNKYRDIHPYLSNNPNVLNIAHRGGLGYLQKILLQASKEQSKRADILELDVRLLH